MKRYILIAAIFLAGASMARAQSPRTPDPQQHQMIKNAEASRMKTYNDKSKPRLKYTDLNRLNKEREISKVEQWEKGKSDYLTPRSSENYNNSLEKLRKAEREKTKAEKALSVLLDKQQAEMAKLLAKIDKAVAEGRDCSSLESEKMRLEEKHTRKVAEAQEKLVKANQKYEVAVKGYKKAGLEIEKTR